MHAKHRARSSSLLISFPVFISKFNKINLFFSPYSEFFFYRTSWFDTKNVFAYSVMVFMQCLCHNLLLMCSNVCTQTSLLFRFRKGQCCCVLNTRVNSGFCRKTIFSEKELPCSVLFFELYCTLIFWYGRGKAAISFSKLKFL